MVAFAPAEPSSRQQNIDFLRCCAILPVIAFHYSGHYPPEYLNASGYPFRITFGYLGVDLFFAISGYCIMMSLASSRGTAHFLAKRMSRIQPAYVAAIILTYAVVSAFGLPGWDVSPLQALGNMVWFNFSDAVPHVDGPYWSLVIELKFYLWIAMLWRFRDLVSPLVAWSLISAVGFALDLLGAHLISDKLFIAPYALCFIPGILAWRWNVETVRTRALTATACLVMLALSPRYGNPAAGVVIAVLGFLGLQWKSLRVPRFIAWIGVISYPLYLVHNDIGLVIIRAMPGVPIVVRWTIAGTAVFALAFAMHKTVELRWRKPVERWFERLLSFPVASRRAPAQ